MRKIAAALAFMGVCVSQSAIADAAEGLNISCSGVVYKKTVLLDSEDSSGYAYDHENYDLILKTYGENKSKEAGYIFQSAYISDKFGCLFCKIDYAFISGDEIHSSLAYVGNDTKNGLSMSEGSMELINIKINRNNGIMSISGFLNYPNTNNNRRNGTINITLDGSLKCKKNDKVEF